MKPIFPIFSGTIPTAFRLGLIGCAWLPATLTAATLTWDGGGADNKFNTAANWNPDAAVTAIGGNDFRFGPLVTGGQATADVNVGGNFSSLWFNSGAAAMTLTASANSMQFATGTATQIQNDSSNAQYLNTTLRSFWIGGAATRTWNAASGDLTYQAVLMRPDSSVANNVSLIITGDFNHTVNTTLNLEGTWTGKTAGVTKNGAGTLLLKGSGNYNGATTISAGIIRIQNGSSLGTGTVTESEKTDIKSGAALEIAGSLAMTEFIRVAGTGVGGNGAIRAVSGTTNHNTQIAMEGTGGATVSFGVDPGAVLKVNKLYSDIGRDTNFEKVGAGTLVFKSNDSDAYVGNTTISAGILQVGDGGTAGELKTSGVTNNASLVFNRTNNYEYSGAIAGTGSLTQAGSGTLALAGNSTYQGATLVSAGTLLVNGSLSDTSSVSVASGAKLGGTGAISAPLTVAAGGFLAPGAGIGSLDVNGATTISGTLQIDYDGTGPGTIDLLDVGGALNITNATVDFSMLTGGGALDDVSYVFATYTSLIGSHFSSVSNLPAGYSIDYAFQGNSIALVPEPSAVTMACIALGWTCARRRRFTI